MYHPFTAKPELTKQQLLEPNPSRMFMHFESLTGYPITERLIELLK